MRVPPGFYDCLLIGGMTVSAILLSACTADIVLPEGATITCAGERQCPDGMTCKEGLCILEGQPFAPTASFETPNRGTGPLSVNVAIADANNDAVDLTVEYSIAGEPWLPATVDGEKAIAASPEGVIASIVWNIESDLGTGYVADIKLRIGPSDKDGTGRPVASDFFAWGNDAPTIESFSADTTVDNVISGAIVLRLVLADSASDTTDIVSIELSVAGDFEDSIALPLATGFGEAFPSGALDSLATSPEGIEHSLVWDSQLTTREAAESAALRITIEDIAPNAGGDTEVITFALRNNAAPSFENVVVGDEFVRSPTFIVPITYELVDFEADRCDVWFDYSTDGGATWSVAVEAPLPRSEGRYELRSAPTGLEHLFFWDTSQLITGRKQSIIVRLHAHDGFPHIDEQIMIRPLARPLGPQNETAQLTFSAFPVASDPALLRDLNLATADFNGDGLPDLAVSNYEGGVFVLLNDGAGEMQLAATSGVPGSPQLGHTGSLLEAGDFNGDGLADIVWGSFRETDLQFFAGDGDIDGDGSIVLSSPSAVPLTGEVIAGGVDDLDGDGILDVIATTKVVNDGYIETWLSSTGTVVSSPLPSGLPGSHRFALGDFDGDGLQDVATSTTRGQDYRLVIALGQGSVGHSGSFQVSMEAEARPTYLEDVDVDHDGRSELISLEQSELRIYQIPLGSSLVERLAIPASNDASLIAAGNYNGNELVDFLVVSGTPTGGVATLRFFELSDPSLSGVQTLNRFQVLESPVYGLRHSVVADFTGDGVQDVRLGISEYDGVGGINAFIVSLNSRLTDGPEGASYNEVGVQGLPGSSYSLVGDVEGDGIPELVAIAQRGFSSEFSLMQSEKHGDVPSGRFMMLTSVEETDHYVTEAAFADLNGDGRQELFLGDPGGYAPPSQPTLIMYEVGEGPPHLGPRTTLPLATQGSPGFRLEVYPGTQRDQLFVRYRDGFSDASSIVTHDGTELVSTPVPVVGAMADVDADGELDVVAANGSSIDVYLGPFGATPSPSSTIPVEADDGSAGTETGSAGELLLVDVDGNGWLDIVTLARVSGTDYRAWVFAADPEAPGTFNPVAEQWLCGLARGDAFIVDMTGDGAPDLLHRTKELAVYTQRAPSHLGCADPRFGPDPLVLSDGVSLPAKSSWDVNLDGRLDIVTVNPVLDELTTWTGVQAIAASSLSTMLAPPPITSPGIRTSVIAALPIDRGGRARVGDSLAIRPSLAGRNPAHEHWRAWLSNDGVSLPASFFPFTGSFEVFGDTTLQHLLVDGQTRLQIEHRLGAMVESEPVVVRRGLDLENDGTGVVVELPIRSEYRGVDLASSIVRVFLRRRSTHRASEQLNDPLAGHPNASNLVSTVLSIDGVRRAVVREDTSITEILRGDLATGSGPRFEIDEQRHLLRALIDAEGDLVAFVSSPP